MNKLKCIISSITVTGILAISLALGDVLYSGRGGFNTMTPSEKRISAQSWGLLILEFQSTE